MAGYKKRIKGQLFILLIILLISAVKFSNQKAGPPLSLPLELPYLPYITSVIETHHKFLNIFSIWSWCVATNFGEDTAMIIFYQQNCGKNRCYYTQENEKNQKSGFTNVVLDPALNFDEKDPINSWKKYRWIYPFTLYISFTW